MRCAATDNIAARFSSQWPVVRSQKSVFLLAVILEWARMDIDCLIGIWFIFLSCILCYDLCKYFLWGMMFDFGGRR